MDDKYYINILKEEIKIKLGRSLDAPTDFDLLSAQVKEKLHEYISPTTLKRFFNYIPNDVIPRVSTLSLLSRFVGAIGWKDYCDKIDKCSNKQIGEINITTENFTDGSLINKTENQIIIEHQSANSYLYFQKIHSSTTTEIYSATYQGRKVAIKTLKQEYRESTEHNDMLLQQFAISFPIVHENIVATIGLKSIEGLGNSIITEYCGEENILQRIQKRRTSPEEILPLIEQLCNATDFLHTKGYSHNNLIAENILISDNNTLKIIDFSKCTRCTASEEDEQTDLQSIGKLLEQLNVSMNKKFQNIKRIIEKCASKSPQNRYMSAALLYKDLSETKSLPYTAILITSILFTAIISSLLSYNIGQSCKHDYIYIDSLGIEQNKVTDISSSIVIYDTISKMAIKESYDNCRRILREANKMPSNKEKIICFAKEYKVLLKEKEEYPHKILDKYLPKACPEYNLYMTSLVKLKEDIYQKFFNETIDSLKKRQIEDNTIKHPDIINH